MKTVLFLAALGVLLALIDAHKCDLKLTGDLGQDYADYVKCMHPNYKPDRKHRERFEKFKRCVELHNLTANSSSEHKRGFTEFCHWTDEEFNRTRNNFLNPEVMPAGELAVANFDPRQPVPAKCSWREKNVMPEVKKQGDCGSCYTFAAVACIEAAYARKHGKVVAFSEQEYVDCSMHHAVVTWSQKLCRRQPDSDKCLKEWDEVTVKPGRGNQGCKGGDYRACWMYNNMTKNEHNAHDCYKYISDKTMREGACKPDKNCHTKVKVLGYVNVKNDVKAVKQAVCQHGPLACSLNADTIKYYKEGIIRDAAVGVNHAVVLVGYDSEKGKEYWIMRNSWGTAWGYGGYFHVAIEQTKTAIGALGLCSCAYPVIA